MAGGELSGRFHPGQSHPSEQRRNETPSQNGVLWRIEREKAGASAPAFFFDKKKQKVHKLFLDWKSTLDAILEKNQSSKTVVVEKTEKMQKKGMCLEIFYKFSPEEIGFFDCGYKVAVLW